MTEERGQVEPAMAVQPPVRPALPCRCGAPKGSDVHDRTLTYGTHNYAPPPEECPDGGACHHDCEPSACFRVRCCGPLSGVYPGDRWPAEVTSRHGAELALGRRVTFGEYQAARTGAPVPAEPNPADELAEAVRAVLTPGPAFLPPEGGRQRLLDALAGYDTARQMLAIHDETVAARVAAAPDSDLLRRALNDPGHFVKRKHDEHESLVDWQVRAYAAALLAEQPGGRRLCDDRGPRIGGEGCPRCRLQIGHTGSHRPFPEDGWGDISW